MVLDSIFHSKEKGLYLNVQKVMAKSVCEVSSDITVVGETTKLVKNFKYLGSLIDNNIDTKLKIKEDLPSVMVNWYRLINCGQE